MNATVIQLEEVGAELQQQQVWQPMLMYNENSFHRSSHTPLVKLLTHPGEPLRHRRVTLIHCFFRPKRVVRQWVSAKNT